MCLHNQPYLFLFRLLRVFVQCSASCGVGVQNRDVYCRLKGSGRVRDDACDARQRPAEARPCQRADCTHYTWVAGDWEEVSTPTPPGSGFLSGSGSLSTMQMSRCLARFYWPGSPLVFLFSAPLNRRPADALALLRHSRGAFVDNHRTGKHFKARTCDGPASLLSC